MMPKLINSILLALLLPFAGSSQSEDAFIHHYKDSTEYRIILKTQVKTENEFVTRDVFTIKVYRDSTKVYYVRYGDMLISSLMMEYGILNEIIAFEEKINALACTDEVNCTVQILIEGASNSYVIPLDLLHEELLSNLMLELEQ